MTSFFNLSGLSGKRQSPLSEFLSVSLTTLALLCYNTYTDIRMYSG